MPNRVNCAIELLAEGQPVYYTGAHAGHVLTYAQGTEYGGFGRVFTRAG